MYNRYAKIEHVVAELVRMNFANVVDLAAENVPVKPAVGDTTELLTYAALSEETDAAANALHSLGVEPEDRVAICLRNRLDFLTAHLGAMKLGAVPLPINTQFNDAQIRYVLDTSNVSVIVTNGQFEDVATSVETSITIDGSVGHDYHDVLERA